MVPDEFVPLAEETGLVVELGRWVLEAAADEAARWQVEHEQPFVVSVNLSARQLAQPGLAERCVGGHRAVRCASPRTCASRSPRAC